MEILDELTKDAEAQGAFGPSQYEQKLASSVERLERALGQLSIAVQGPQPTFGGPQRDPDLLAIVTEQTPPMKTDAEYLEERGR
jgi:hypothetical protein